MLHLKQVLLLIVLILSLSNCSSNKYLVQPTEAVVLIDGYQVEWMGRFQIPRDQNFALGMSSNRNYLYLALTSMDRDFQRQLALGGLTVWLDIKGGKQEKLGIKYQKIDLGNRRQQRLEVNSERGYRSDREEGLSGKLTIPDGDMDLTVINEKGRERLGPADLLATCGTKDGSLFIEYQIPLVLLSSDFDFTRILGLGIQSVFERPDRTKSGPESMSGGGRGGMQGGRSGGQMGGGGHSQGGNRPSGSSKVGQADVEVWVKVQFAQH
ncbi:MAG: hypothetical protein HQ508_02540 [Candidatus Marinimicrobia bacterium]|nr:hypothetical protein [Candidatus Neomarinimicrobiota bacterium]